MHMKTGVEQSVYALVLLNMLPDKAVLSGKRLASSSEHRRPIFRNC